ncbi:MAG: site-specific integrase, partial [Myxococcales bacterium]|nr:site-specific integrase [Myxococcales bacterium]
LRALERHEPIDAELAPSQRHHAPRTVAADERDGWTLLHAFSDFLDYGCRDKSPKTREMYVQKARHLLRVLGREVLIATLELEDVDEYLRVREGEGAHPGTVYKEIVALRQCLKWAKGRRHFSRDISSVIPPIKNTYQPRKRHLKDTELPRLLEQLRSHHRWWVVVAIYSAGRRSEIERLAWEHVDLGGGWLNVPGTKTRRAERTLPLHPFLRQCLQAVPELERHGRLVQPWPSVNRDLRAACERAGIAAVSPNDLRRSFASWLKQAGEDSLVVAKLLGHASTTMVERVYGHLGDENYRRAVDKLPPALAPVTADPSAAPPPAGRCAPTRGTRPAPTDTKSAGARPSSQWVVTADVRQAAQSRSTSPHEISPMHQTPSLRPQDGVSTVSPVGFEPTTRGLKGREQERLSARLVSIKVRTKRQR